MCGRFYIETDDTPDELLEILNRASLKAAGLDPAAKLSKGEIRPGDYAAVIALDKALSPAVFPMQWGFRSPRGLLINARSETAAEKPTFRNSMAYRRCIIPASAYFEWDHRVKPFPKLSFYRKDSGLIYLAGLYRFEPDKRLPVFSVLTREAVPSLACYHDRMPVIFDQSMTDRWLSHSSSPMQLLSHAVTDLQCSPA